MEFQSSIWRVEAPTFGSSGGISLPLQRLNVSVKGRLVGDTLPQAGPRQDTELDLRHPFGKLSTRLSQLPCLGVWWNSRRFTMRRASGAEKASYKEAGR